MIGLVLVACSEPATVGSTSTTEAPASTPAPSTSTTLETSSPFPEADIGVGSADLRVWVADEREERVQGLRRVSELPPGIDGMLFVFDEPTETAFVMEDTLIPLDVWFFDAEGMLVGSHEMVPCSETPCPRYPTPGPVLWAVETPAGERSFPSGASLTTSP